MIIANLVNLGSFVGLVSMQVKMCPDEYVGTYIGEKTLWCDSKCKCGRCFGTAEGRFNCNRKWFYSTVDCDICKHRFVCYTSSNFEQGE